MAGSWNGGRLHAPSACTSREGLTSRQPFVAVKMCAVTLRHRVRRGCAARAHQSRVLSRSNATCSAAIGGNMLLGAQNGLGQAVGPVPTRLRRSHRLRPMAVSQETERGTIQEASQPSTSRPSEPHPEWNRHHRGHMQHKVQCCFS